MAVSCVLLLTILGVEVTGKSSESLESELECCVDATEVNITCLAKHRCSAGCYRWWNEDGSSSCVKCENETLTATPAYNLTDCRNHGARGMNSQANVTTVPPVTFGVGGPEVAASLIFGTFMISLFLILCVASFFYLKRANKLPNLFYRRSKGSVVQSAESASMLSPPSSVRKPRYVRRERSLMTSGTTTTLAAETRVSNV
uniref:Chromosome 1 open reading frame 159 n=1 Tax=Salvator merianae TaxID=96440 RepID=A0A8D0BR62_SALMN